MGIAAPLPFHAGARTPPLLWSRTPSPLATAVIYVLVFLLGSILNSHFFTVRLELSEGERSPSRALRYRGRRPHDAARLVVEGLEASLGLLGSNTTS